MKREGRRREGGSEGDFHAKDIRAEELMQCFEEETAG